MREMMRGTDTDTARGHVSTIRPAAVTPAQQLARERFERQIGRLRDETSRGRPRPNLDVLVRLCEGLLDDAGTGPIVAQYRTELGRAKAAVTWGEGRLVR
jgi:hypothetical protein